MEKIKYSYNQNSTTDCWKLVQHVLKVGGNITDLEFAGGHVVFTVEKPTTIFDYKAEQDAKKLWDLQRKI